MPTPTPSVELTGRVVRPGDADYSEAKAGWNLLFRHDPSVIVFAGETVDVVNALTWARQNEMRLRVRSGGHCLEGWSSVDNGIIIDVSELKSTSVDAAARTATVGAGLSQIEAVIALGKAGFAAPTGTEGSVGLAGATLGGGFGLLTRVFGMACDNVLSAEVVIASSSGGAEVITVSESHNTDLLWALRGAGNGNFGIVTSLTYSIHPLAQSVYVTATWSGLCDLRRVFLAWQNSAPEVDNRLTSQLEIRGDGIVLVGLLATGSEKEALQMLAPILAVGDPDISTTSAPWADTYTAFQIPTDDEPANWKFLSEFVYEPFPAEAIDAIGSFMAKAPTMECNYFTNALGGAVRDCEPPGGSAYAHRNAIFYAEPGAGWGVRGGAPVDAQLATSCQNWVTEFDAALRPFVNGAYVNVPNAGMPDWESAYWGAGVGRLRGIKAKYDPGNVFEFEQSISAVADEKPARI